MYRVVHQRLALSVVRLALASLGFVGSLLAGAGGAAAGVGVALGTGISSLALLTDRRWMLLGRPTSAPLPVGAHREPLHRAVTSGLLPSTVGVALLAAVSLAFQPLLAAVLAGILAGMGVVGLAGWAEVVLWERQQRVSLFADAAVHTRRYVAPSEPSTATVTSTSE